MFIVINFVDTIISIYQLTGNDIQSIFFSKELKYTADV